jgi:ArsR family transcriptional regulator
VTVPLPRPRVTAASVNSRREQIEITGAKQTTVSHHLRILREAGIVLSEAEGRFTWYRITPGAFADGLRQLRGITQAAESTPRLRPACAS